jgi:hypothetical protein
MTTKVPSVEDAEKCIKFRKLSKQGVEIGKEGHAFCRTMFEHYRKWYSDTEERVFNETVPFGSNVRYRK